ncbi:15-hydroxyprostaglandin dehydrogenase [Caerostris extrusa]|uniref:15-hydroxyprostaglandin dehydrogenase [NAD(+)] n=1 Tax=Caerostris extrusa TaxID=172846 RepID=A0AAV4S8L0_CAEEX|nr:15-hydroxyprostaglandin dehydrogenase [Caerostris extrusa]
MNFAGKVAVVTGGSQGIGLEIFPLGPVYAGTKHAVVGFTKSLGTGYHFRKTGITVNAICPGPVDIYVPQFCLFKYMSLKCWKTTFRSFVSHSPDQTAAEKLISSVKTVKPEEVGKALLKLLEDNKNGAFF